MHPAFVSLRRLVSGALLLTLTRVAGAAPLFEDNFDTNTSANWKQLNGYYAGSAPDDFAAEFAFDYSKQLYKRFEADGVTFVENPIPPAPGSSGTTRGLRVAVNHNDILAERFAVNFYPIGKSFSGNFSLKFDLWMNYNGPAEGGVGSTEHFMAGINHSGNVMNWHSFGATFTEAAPPGVGAEASDGIWVAYAGEGGAAIDGRVVFGAGTGPGTYYAATANPAIGANPNVPSGFLDRDGDNSPDNSDQDAYVATTLFPQPKFETAGAPGKRWVEVEIRQVDDVITCYLDGKLFASAPNSTTFKSGNIMLGYMDIFTSIPNPAEENFAIFDNVRVEPLRKVVVDIVDNNSGPADGKTSLKEALEGLQENDVVTFNIAGTGPHVIATPIGGYPLITKSGVVIDGYSQPGATPNTNPLLGGNNAKLQIVLDSTSDAQTGDAAKPNRASTRLPYPGYGDSENAILGVLGADHVTIRGLSFLGRQTPASDEDPWIYAIALVNEARGAKAQGNWFGLHPDGKTVKGMAAGVAAFRHRVSVNDANVDTFSEGLTVGTDSDGVDDLAEHNLFCGHHIALRLELPEALTAGNYFNVLPDGKTFLNLTEIHQALLDAGVPPDNDSSVESYENGRLTTGSVIGVTGNKINDENERNIFNLSYYDHLIEFYSNATNVVIAGNYFGIGVDRVTTAPPLTERTPDLIEGPGSGSFRFGSDNDGVADDIEGNLVSRIPGTGLLKAGVNVPIVARHNELSGNGFLGFPFADGANSRPYETYYAPYLQTPANAVPVLASYTDGKLTGTVPIPTEAYYPDGIIEVDVYVTDPSAPAGEVIPQRYLGTFLEGNLEQDTNPEAGAFTFDLSTAGVPGGRKLCVVAAYSSSGTASEAGSSVTGPVSNAVDSGGSVGPGPLTVTRTANGVSVTYTGILQSAPAITGTWADVTGATSPYAVPATGTAQFYRAR